MPQKCPKSLCGVGGGGGVWCVVVCKPNLVKCFGPRLRLWTWTLDFVPGPSFSKKKKVYVNNGQLLLQAPPLSIREIFLQIRYGTRRVNEFGYIYHILPFSILIAFLT